MLVCPQCQFENPDANRFCQRCGISLTEKICPTCETLVPFDLLSCPNCSTVTGTIWRAILTSHPVQASDPPIQTEEIAQSTPVELPKSLISAKSPLAKRYLDLQQRYRLLEPLPDSGVMGVEVEVTVLDCQPFQPSLLEILYREELDNFSEGSSKAALAETLAIPAIAEVYLALHQERYPSMPQIHDAWEQDGQRVVLLEERMHLPRLADLWGDEDIMQIQILYWLHETIEIWALLQRPQCGKSLLELNNLRVDEDQVLYLQRLYVDESNNPSELQNLGRLWKRLFQQSQRTHLGPLVQLCHDLEAGKILNLDQLRSRFEAIANELQPNSTPMDITPDSIPLNSTSPDEDGSDLTEELPQPTPSDQQPPQLISPDVQSPPTPVAPDMSFSTTPTLIEVGNIEDDVVSENDDIPTVVLPMKLITLEDSGRTDIGRQREHNEDCFSLQADVKKLEGPASRMFHVKGIYILCDGMGGHAGGEVASALAVDTLRQYFESHWQDQLPGEDTIREAIYLANKAIYDLNQESARSGSGRMGTTLVLLLVQDTQAAIAHVGDSRLYRFSRRRGLEQITTDHEVGQREIQRGVEPAIAYARPDAYQLTQALGPRDENFISPEVQFMELNEDLLLLLCSDGLTDNDLLETHWRTHLEPLLGSQTNLEQGVNQLIDLANQYNGHDNITAIAIRTKVRPNLEQLKRS